MDNETLKNNLKNFLIEEINRKFEGSDWMFYIGRIDELVRYILLHKKVENIEINDNLFKEFKQYIKSKKNY